MNISLSTNDTQVNFKVAVVLETPKGFVFEKSKHGFYSAISGRIKVNEASIDAAIRKLEEKLHITVEEMHYAATVESFFTHKSLSFHEIIIIYHAQSKKLTLSDNFRCFNAQKIQKKIIKPAIVKEMISMNDFALGHKIARD